MDMKPILTFNKPNTNGIRGPLPRGGSKVSSPGLQKQSKRIFPKVEALETKFSETAWLSGIPDGMQPEKVLVLEIAGDVQQLVGSLTKVPGLEFLSQNLLEKSFQDDLFFEEKKGIKKPIAKNAYLAMSNQSGLRKLYSMWKRFVESGYKELGSSPLMNAFLQLSDIRFWDTKDRLESTYVLEDWKDRLCDANQGWDEVISFEIELWFRPKPVDRVNAESHIRKVITSSGGEILNSFIHEGIHYHALLGKLPLSKVKEVVESSGAALELMRCDEVMFFRPLGQCIVPQVEGDAALHEQADIIKNTLSNEYSQPIVALLDGLPLSNHEALSGRLRIDDPDDFESLYRSASEQVHGTSMASIIIHGDLNNRLERTLESPLYVRPILAPEREGIDGSRQEQIPSTFLPIDLVHRAVVRMKEGENGLPPEAPEVMIINLSIGDPYRLFDTQMSPWARMLDWLSHRYKVLFVVSAGNMPLSIKLMGVKENSFSELSKEKLEEYAINAISKQKHERRMMSPAEAVNALTVSSSHDDHYQGSLIPNQIDIFNARGLFSPINPVTLGRKNSIKPEILMPGGRQTYVNRTVLPNDDINLVPSKSVSFGPGVKTALPSSNQGSINYYGFTIGTSNAAALATRRLALLSETLREIKEFGDRNALSSAPDALLLKALLAHGAEHIEEATSILTKHLKKKNNSRTFKSDLNQFLGFGVVNEARIHGCKKNQATLIYTGIIKDESSHEYRLPLPSCLSAGTVERRLIVTIAWFTPVNYKHQDYRGAQLWATPQHEALETKDGDYYYHHLKNGTIFHEVKKGSKAVGFTDGDDLAIKVHCKGRAGMENIEIPYALIVTLDTPSVDLPIYEEVKQGLDITISQEQEI